jgi:hypothetical protein
MELPENPLILYFHQSIVLSFKKIFPVSLPTRATTMTPLRLPHGCGTAARDELRAVHPDNCLPSAIEKIS